jgi:hypothetical protein
MQTPKIIKVLIRDTNWRLTLIGNAVTILLNASEFEEDLTWRLTHSTWVAPQVATGIALVSKGSALLALEELLNKAVQAYPAYETPRIPDGVEPTVEMLDTLFNQLVSEETPPECEPKTILSAYAALKFLGHPKAREFDQTAVFPELISADHDRCLTIAMSHWNFWKTVTPITSS